MTSTNRARIILRCVAAAGFIGAGIMHFAHADTFKKIVPPVLPAPGALVAISGFFEIAGGLGLLIRPVRRAAGWGLIALLIAVFPANVYMAVAPDRIPEMNIPNWALWARLPLQVMFIVWVWFASRDPG